MRTVGYIPEKKSKGKPVKEKPEEQKEKPEEEQDE